MCDIPKLPPHLPPPTTNGDFIALAVLHDLRGLRADLAADRADRVKASADQPAPVVNLAAVIPGIDPATVDIKEPGLSPTVAERVRAIADRENPPPLSDEAGQAMARALDDGRPKTKANYRKKAAEQ